jgi:putative Mg2+ transporter-C (MgtC) family protein
MVVLGVVRVGREERRRLRRRGDGHRRVHWRTTVSAYIPAIGEPTEIEVVGRLLLAALLGGILGVERELDGQDAGFRTHLLLALGAALFGAISVGAFTDFADSSATNVQVDVTRVASYVAAGIGFIGGGAILKHRGTITGITTATSLWTSAAVGLAAGLGFWVGAVATAVIAVAALRGLKPFSNWLQNRGTPSSSNESPAAE